MRGNVILHRWLRHEESGNTACNQQLHAQQPENLADEAGAYLVPKQRKLTRQHTSIFALLCYRFPPRIRASVLVRVTPLVQ